MANDLDPASLWRTASIVGNRRNIRDVADFKATIVQRADGRLTTGTGPLNLHIKVFHTIFLSRNAGAFGRHLSGKRRAFPGTAKPRPARRRPGEGIALAVSDGDDSVIKRRVDMSNAIDYGCLDLLSDWFLTAFCHFIYPV